MYEKIVFDMDGVIRVGNKLIDGSTETLEYMQRNGIKGALCTNEDRYTEEEIREDLYEMGFDIPDNWQVVTSGMVVNGFLHRKIKKNHMIHYDIGIIGETGLYSTLSTLTELDNCTVTEHPRQSNSNKILVIGTLNTMKMSSLNKALEWIKAGAKVVTTCIDISDPASRGDFNLCMPNHTLHLLKYNVSVPKPYSLGKPNPIYARYFIENGNINPSKTLFVGDTMYTDMRMAEENGLDSCLVLSGNTKKEALKRYVTEPTYVLESISNIPSLLSDRFVEKST